MEPWNIIFDKLVFDKSVFSLCQSISISGDVRGGGRVGCGVGVMFYNNVFHDLVPCFVLSYCNMFIICNFYYHNSVTKK